MLINKAGIRNRVGTGSHDFSVVAFLENHGPRRLLDDA